MPDTHEQHGATHEPARAGGVVFASAPGGYRFAETDLVRVGRRSATPDSPCWGTDRQTGDGPLLGFTHAPIRVRFGADDPVVLTSATLATPGSEHPFTSGPVTERGEDTTFVRFLDDTVARLCAPHDASAMDRPERPVPWCVSPADTVGSAAMRRVSAAVFESGEAVDRVWFEETIIGIAERTIAGVYRARGARRRGDGADRVGGEAVRHVCAQIAARYGEALGIADLAAIAGYAPGHFCRKFRAHTGTTIHAYLTSVRLVAAVERLPERRGMVARLAHETGFASHAHLSSVFKRVLGATPTEVRDEHAAWCARALSRRLSDAGQNPRAG